jgi:hypothetical protein
MEYDLGRFLLERFKEERKHKLDIELQLEEFLRVNLVQ